MLTMTSWSWPAAGPAGRVSAAGLAASFGSPLANGLRGRLASSVLAGTAVAAGAWLPACALGGADGVPAAPASRRPSPRPVRS